MLAETDEVNGIFAEAGYRGTQTADGWYDQWRGVLTVVNGANIAVWLLLYHQLHEQPTGSLGGTARIKLMLFLGAAYVFGCAFRSFLPRADVQRICLFDTWLSSVAVGPAADSPCQ